MMKIKKLREIGVELIDCDHKTPKAQTSGYYYVGIPQMKGGRIETEGARLISRKDFIQWTKKAQPKEWDIVLSRRCNPGVTAIVTNEFEFALGQNLVLLRSDGINLHPPFLKWLVQSSSWWEQVSKFLNVGAVFESLKCADIPEFELPIPDLKVQKGIASILENLDRKIILLRKNNSTLEEVAQTLFKRWFVDFEFPDENGNPYKSSGGKMVDSELGEIPEGWRVGMLGDEFDIIMGQSPSGSSFNENKLGKVFYQGKTDFGFRFPTNRLYTTEPNRIANKYDVLVSVRAPVGDVNMASEDCCIGRGLGAVRSQLKSYCFNKIKSLNKAFAVFESEGTVFGSISKKDFIELEVIVPEKQIAQKYNELYLDSDMKIFENEKTIQSLTQLRDTLLPKLMSGEIKINN